MSTDQEVRGRPPDSGHPGETGQLTSDSVVLRSSSEHPSRGACHTTISCHYFYETVLCSDPSSGSRCLPPQLCPTADSPISQELPLAVGTGLPKVTFSVSTRVNLPISVCFRLQSTTAAFIQLPASSKGVFILLCFTPLPVASNIC